MKAIIVSEKQRTEIKWRFWAALTTLCAFVGQSIVVVFYSESMPVKVDTIHVSSDLAIMLGGLVVAILGTYMSTGRSETLRKIFTIVGILLLVLGALYARLEVHERLLSPVVVTNLTLVFFTGLFGLTLNKLAHSLLDKIPKHEQGHDHKVMSLHLLFDMALSAIVSISVVAHVLFGWGQADLMLGDFAAMFIIFLAGRLSAEVWKDDCQSTTKNPHPHRH